MKDPEPISEARLQGPADGKIGPIFWCRKILDDKKKLDEKQIHLNVFFWGGVGWEVFCWDILACFLLKKHEKHFLKKLCG